MSLEPGVVRVWKLCVGPGPLAAQFVDPAWADPHDQRLAERGGFALGVALLRSAQAAGQDWPWILSIGRAVREGLPTAARASVMARSPLTQRYSDGQVGSVLARRVAAVADALWIEGHARERSVLVLDRDGHARLEPAGFARELGLPERCAWLAEHYATRAVLACGPAAELGISAASLGAGTQPTSFTGRGLGAALAQHGVVALVFRGEEAAPARAALARAQRWVSALQQSPRLLERARSGTLESALPLALREAQPAVDRSVAAAGALGHKHGCAGCPTPCGWVFANRRQTLHHSALAPLWTQTSEQAQALLEQCNHWGLDSKALARWRATYPGLEPAQWCADPQRYPTPPELETHSRAPAARWAARLSLRATDPLRNSPFLLHDAPDAAALRRALAPLPLSEAGADPSRLEQKGRSLWWHENLMAALDSSGVCAFSVAALLSDGVLDLDGLAALLEEGLDGPSLLEQGAQALLALAELDPLPSLAEPSLAAESAEMVWEYRALRGLGPDARPTAWALRAAQQGRLCQASMQRFLAEEIVSTTQASTPQQRQRGRVSLLLHGSLAQAFGSERECELDLPCTLAELRAHLGADPRWSQASAWCQGRKLDTSSWIDPGMRIELVVALSGG